MLISGKSGTGKSTSLRNLPDNKSVWYLNTENGKSLPFPNNFEKHTITDPYQIFEAIEVANTDPSVEYIVVDSLTFLMDMYESSYVLTSTNTQKAWGDYHQFFKKLMNDYVAVSAKKFIFIAHTSDILSDEGVLETKVKVKGALMDRGIEAYFTVVVSTKNLPLKKLTGYTNDLLAIDEDEEIVGYKNVFQTRLTKDTTGERIRSPMKMWSIPETYIDNDVVKVIDRITKYYP